MDEIHIEREDITSQRAKHLLADNAENQRNIRMSKVDQYVRDMLAGAWPITGETIKVSVDGKLLDGQHRLTAVIRAAVFRPDIAVPMLVAHDVDPAVMPVLDTGIPRGLHDLVNVLGVSSGRANLTAAVVRRVLQWEQGNYLGATGQSGGSPTHTEALQRLSKDVEGFTAAAARGRDMQATKMTPGAPAGTAFYLFRQIDADKAHAFFDQLISGADLPQSSPILTLRNRLIGASRLKAFEYVALYVRAWNAWREDRTLGQILITNNTGRLTNQNFPIPK